MVHNCLFAAQNSWFLVWVWGPTGIVPAHVGRFCTRVTSKEYKTISREITLAIIHSLWKVASVATNSARRSVHRRDLDLHMTVLTTEGILTLLCGNIPINYKVASRSSQQKCGLNRNPICSSCPQDSCSFFGFKELCLSAPQNLIQGTECPWFL